jgi:hypothetical protein
LSVQVFHDDESLAVLLVDLVDGADIGMVEGGSGSCFAPEALQRLMVFGYVVRKELERDKAAQFDVLGFIDHTHTAAAELLNDAVVRDSLADHEQAVPGTTNGQS